MSINLGMGSTAVAGGGEVQAWLTGVIKVPEVWLACAWLVGQPCSFVLLEACMPAWSSSNTQGALPNLAPASYAHQP